MAKSGNTPPLDVQAEMIAEHQQDPSHKPPHMFLRGHMGPYELNVPVFSMTVGLNLTDMFEKAARRTKVSCQLDLWATDGTWTESAWRSLKHSAVSGETHRKPVLMIQR